MKKMIFCSLALFVASSTLKAQENLTLKVRKFQEQNLVQVQGLPANPRITNLSWSPDDRKLAFTNTTSNAVELWVLDVATAKATKVTDKALNANLGRPFSWYKDNQSLLVKTIPANRPALIDAKKGIPTGPIISNNDGSKAQNRTYADMLKNKNRK